MDFPHKPLKTPQKHTETLHKHQDPYWTPIQTHSIPKGSQETPVAYQIKHNKISYMSFAIPKIYGLSLTISSQIHHARNCQPHQNLNRSR